MLIPEGDIPYGELAEWLFQPDSRGKQVMVPFLGAGVSAAGAPAAAGPAWGSGAPPAPDVVNQVISLLNLTGRSAQFMKIAVLLVSAVAAADQSGQIAPTLEQTLQGTPYPPSARQLAYLFSERAKYTSFRQFAKQLARSVPLDRYGVTEGETIDALRLLAQVTGLANPPDTLTSITSYYEAKIGRGQLLRLIRGFLGDKKTATPVHELVADAARANLNKGGDSDYLIITTNYDCLMERALENPEKGPPIPYVVLVTSKKDRRVLARFSEDVADRDVLFERHSGKMFPARFAFDRQPLPKAGSPPQSAQRLVVLYKIHGCAVESSDAEAGRDGIVISDADYVDYISQMSNADGVIPAAVTNMMGNRRFLFLGYSLSDWNVRSIFKTVQQKRLAEDPDFSVNLYVNDYEQVFFDRNNINVCNTDLKSFVAGIRGKHS
jgi:hypothetical protein